LKKAACIRWLSNDEKEIKIMKRSMIYILVITAFVMLISLGSEEVLAKGENEIIVKPSGDETGRVDRVRIQGALVAVHNSASLDTVSLTNGTYYISGAIDVPGFSGNIVGSGIDETYINVVPNQVSDGFLRHDPYWDNWIPGNPAYITVLFNFSPILNGQEQNTHRHVTISDMTFTVFDNPVDEYFNTILRVSSTKLNSICYISGGSFDSTFENLKIEGNNNLLFPLGVAGGSDWFAALLGSSRGEGTHIVRNVNMSNYGGIGYEAVGWGGDSLIELTSTRFENWGWYSHFYLWNDPGVSIIEACELAEPNVVVCP
jgi:hypothetical protein